MKGYWLSYWMWLCKRYPVFPCLSFSYPRCHIYQIVFLFWICCEGRFGANNRHIPAQYKSRKYVFGVCFIQWRHMCIIYQWEQYLLMFRSNTYSNYSIGEQLTWSYRFRKCAGNVCADSRQLTVQGRELQKKLCRSVFVTLCEKGYFGTFSAEEKWNFNARYNEIILLVNIIIVGAKLLFWDYFFVVVEWNAMQKKAFSVIMPPRKMAFIKAVAQYLF